MLPTYENPSDEEAGGDEGPGVQRLRGKGRDQRQKLHGLQGEGGQDTDHPGLDERRRKLEKNNDNPVFLRWAQVWCSRARLCAGSATGEERSFLQAAGPHH